MKYSSRQSLSSIKIQPFEWRKGKKNVNKDISKTVTSLYHIDVVPLKIKRRETIFLTATMKNISNHTKKSRQKPNLYSLPYSVQHYNSFVTWSVCVCVCVCVCGGKIDSLISQSGILLFGSHGWSWAVTSPAKQLISVNRLKTLHQVRRLITVNTTQVHDEL